MKNFPCLWMLMLAVAWIYFWTGFAVSEVGQVYSCDKEPVGAMLPLFIFFLMAVPSVLSSLWVLNQKETPDENT